MYVVHDTMIKGGGGELGGVPGWLVRITNLIARNGNKDQCDFD